MTATLMISAPIAVTGAKSARTQVECSGEAARATNPFERLVQIIQSNDRLLAELRRAERRLEQAIAYTSDPDSARDLGTALLAHARQKRARLVTQLRSNRTEALAILAGESDPA